MKPQLEQTLEKYYKVSQPTDNIFRCERNVGDKPYEIVYFDNSEGLKEIRDNEALNDYIRKKLLSDYYKNPGAIQWNFYYAFLVDDANLRSKKTFVFRNTEFARKFIIPRNQLKDWLKDEYDFSSITEKNIVPELSSIWLKEFDKVGYNFIFDSKTAPDGGWQYILAGKKLETSENLKDDVLPSDNPSAHLRAISNLNIGKFRSYPQKRNFEFKRVNLVFASNGFGKTSLLESIEAFFCGYNIQTQQDIVSSDNQISIRFNNSTEEVDLAQSLNRGNLLWRNKFYYKSEKVYLPQKKLAENFSRFNYFHADAAFKLAQTNHDEIRQIFEKLIFGYAFSEMDKRIVEYAKLLEKGLDNELKDQADLDSIYLSKNDELKELTKIESLENNQLEKDLLLTISKISFRNLGKLDGNAQKRNIEVKSLILDLQEILDVFTGIKVKTIGDFKTFLQRTEENKLKLLDLNNALKLLLTEDTKSKELIAENKKQTELLKRYLMYIESGARDKLRNLKEHLDNLEMQIGKIAAINTKGLQEALSNCSDNHLSLSKLLDTYGADLNKLKIQDVQFGMDLKRELERSEDNMVLLADIKKAGKKILKNSPKASICPLCNHDHGNAELLQNSINKVIDGLNNLSRVEELRAIKEESAKKIKELETRNFYVSSITGAYFFLFGKEPAKDIGISVISKVILLEIEKLKVASFTFETLSEVLKNLTKQKITERELADIEEKLKPYFKTINKIGSEEITAKINELEKSLSELVRQSEENEKRTKKTREEAVSFIALIYEAGKSIEQTEKFIAQIEEKVRRVQYRIENVKATIELSDQSDLVKLQEIIISYDNIAKKILAEEEERKKDSVRSNKLKAEISEILLKLDEYKIKLDRISKFKKAFDQISITYSKDTYLSEFFNSNEEELMTIYRQIHTPKDFDGIRFSSSKQLELRRIETQEWDNILHLSSGQRTALALAIFLAFHRRLKEGPKVIIFDDPITFIDDINAVTFFDFLREMVNKDAERQIIFATANEGVAFLFKQKFDYLQEELHIEKLERNEQ